MEVIEDVFQWVPRDNYMMYSDRPDSEALGGFRSGLFTTGCTQDEAGTEKEEEEVPSQEPGEDAGESEIVGPSSRTGMPLPKQS